MVKKILGEAELLTAAVAWAQARAELDKAQAEWDKATAALVQAKAELVKAGAELSDYRSLPQSGEPKMTRDEARYEGEEFEEAASAWAERMGWRRPT